MTLKMTIIYGVKSDYSQNYSQIESDSIRQYMTPLTHSDDVSKKRG